MLSQTGEIIVQIPLDELFPLRGYPFSVNDDELMEQKKPENDGINISGEVLRKYFPRSYSPLRMQEIIIKLLEGWAKRRQRDQSR